MSKRLTISKFAPFNANQNQESERIETFRTFYKKRFRKLQVEESPQFQVAPQNVQLRSGQIPFKRSFQKPKDDVIDVRKFQICELWSYKYNHIVQKVSKLNSVNEFLQNQKSQEKKQKKNKTIDSLDCIPQQMQISSHEPKKFKTNPADCTLPKLESFTTFQSPNSPDRKLSSSQYCSNKSVSEFKGKLKQLIETCDNVQFFSPNKFNKI